MFHKLGLSFPSQLTFSVKNKVITLVLYHVLHILLVRFIPHNSKWQRGYLEEV